MSAILSFSRANPVRMVITSWLNRNANDRECQFFRDFSSPHFDSFFQPFLNTDILTIQFDSSFDATNVVTLKNYKTDAIINTGAATEKADKTTFKVFEKAISIAALDGLFYVEVTGTDADTETYTARSEPLFISGDECNTIKLEYFNDNNAFGIDYENSTVQFDIRIPALFNRTSDTAERELFKDSGGNVDLISSKGTKIRVLKAVQLIPQWLIEKVNIILLHDNVKIDDVEVSSDQSWPYELISDRQLWAEPEANIILASGSVGFINVHDTTVASGDDATVENTDQSYQDTVAPGGTLVIPDITITLNDDTTVTSPAAIDLDIGIIDPCVLPATWAEFVTEYGHGYNYPNPTDGESYRTGDEKWVQDNIFTAAVRRAEDLKPQNSVQSYLVLNNVNVHGNTNRFTDSVGTQLYDGTGGSIDGYIVDHFTGLGWFETVKSVSEAWNDCIDNSLGSDHGGSGTNAALFGFTNWFMASWQQIDSIMDWSTGTGILLSTTPFAYVSTARIHSSSTSTASSVSSIGVRQNSNANLQTLLTKLDTQNGCMICRKHF